MEEFFPALAGAVCQSTGESGAHHRHDVLAQARHRLGGGDGLDHDAGDVAGSHSGTSRGYDRRPILTKTDHRLQRRFERAGGIVFGGRDVFLL